MIWKSGENWKFLDTTMNSTVVKICDKVYDNGFLRRINDIPRKESKKEY